MTYSPSNRFDLPFGRTAVFLSAVLLSLFFFWQAAETSASYLLSDDTVCPTPTDRFYNADLGRVEGFSLNTIQTSGNVNITWNASTNTKVDGYHVSIQVGRDSCLRTYLRKSGRRNTGKTFSCLQIRRQILKRRWRSSQQLLVYITVRAYDNDNGYRNRADVGEWLRDVNTMVCIAP